MLIMSEDGGSVSVNISIFMGYRYRLDSKTPISISNRDKGLVWVKMGIFLCYPYRYHLDS